jgi:hypothetical protein
MPGAADLLETYVLVALYLAYAAGILLAIGRAQATGMRLAARRRVERRDATSVK